MVWWWWLSERKENPGSWNKHAHNSFIQFNSISVVSNHPINDVVVDDDDDDGSSGETKIWFACPYNRWSSTEEDYPSIHQHQMQSII